MDYNEMTNYVKGRIGTYKWHKMNLEGVTEKDKFEQCRDELMADIMDDTKYVRSILAAGIPKPVADLLEVLSRNEADAMNFFVQYKSLYDL